ncbi:nucleotide exchange factor GrpE [Streptomyces sp. A7024]|uniref:Nucleotide exchange factor GrpE n=1 Tax=Streptomyces coryli TaxID=1128680 RepID=A0A6G4TWI8_9ACTN|nr:nucleotide exchange factor GrpE [Streptomyces coryli]NGN63478.1 nucleotide exchange factor GrpE [Streptomyces coryli]
MTASPASATPPEQDPRLALDPEPAPVPPPAPAPEQGPDPFGIVADAVDGMREELATLNDQFRRRLLNDREARRSLDELHGELDHARKDAEGRTLQPLLYDLVLLLDRVDRHPGQEDGFADSVAAELLVIMEKYGMQRIPVTRGPFDPAVQEAVGALAALAPEQNGEVAELVRHGYRIGERIVRPQQVRVYTAQ